MAVCIAMLAALLVGCESPSASNRPSPSLIELEFTPIPTLGPSDTSAPATAAATQAAWPSGWDIAFCTAFADAMVAHELVIDIERAIEDDATDDAKALARELNQTAPLAGGEVNRLRTWDAAADVKTDLAALLDLDEQAAASYVTYFNDGKKADLRAARKVRKQISKAVPAANENLAALADEQGVSCPGTSLEFETL